MAHLLELACDLKTRSVAVHDEDADALAALALVGVGRDKTKVADGSIGDEVLAAVDDVGVALLNGVGRKPGSIGTGVRFGDGVCPNGFTSNGVGEIAGALLLGTKLVNRKCRKVGVCVHRGGDSRRDLCHLLNEDALHDLVGANATVFLWEHDSQESEFSQLWDHFNGELLVPFGFFDEWKNLRGRKFAHHLSEVFLFLRECVTQSHRVLPPLG